MTIVTAKELKTKTGQVLKRVRRGEEIIITLRGEPVARFVPVTNKQKVKVQAQELEEKLRFVRELAGKYKGLGSVDEFLGQKVEEKELEERKFSRG